MDLTKKTIVMFGRHHGDEGTANWIIEGFFKRFLGSAELKGALSVSPLSYDKSRRSHGPASL